MQKTQLQQARTTQDRTASGQLWNHRFNGSHGHIPRNEQLHERLHEATVQMEFIPALSVGAEHLCGHFAEHEGCCFVTQVRVLWSQNESKECNLRKFTVTKTDQSAWNER